MKKVALGLVLGLGSLVAWGQEPPAAEPVATPAVADEQAADRPQPVAVSPDQGVVPAVRRVSYSEAQMRAAIEAGKKSKGRSTALSISDAGRGFMNAMAALGNSNNATAGTGFRLAMYTPLTWVEQQASDAAKVYKPFGPDDVTDDMLRPVLRIVVYPDKATDFRNQAQTSSVEHVVVRDEARRRVLQPLSLEPFAEGVQTVGGAQLQYTGMLATFDLDEVRTLMDAPGLDEFFVTVIGEGAKEKNFKIKNKRFKDLPGLK
jgi:hypothetical protein